MASSRLLIYAFQLWFLWFYIFPPMDAQLMWTSIYLGGGNSQIDLWTQEAKGCACPWNRTDHQCACCVAEGGCHCGKNASNRCTQCGLEEHCNHMCNVTIISSELIARSGKSFGQIKSPSLEGPGACWYTFIPSSTQRVEVQIYRLVNAGKHNGTSCLGGFLQLAGGTEPQYSFSDNQICGSNERYAPPVVFFADDGLATLLFQITEKTRRSQFLAYFSFTSINNSDGMGYQPRGGMKLQNTDCDWLYQDFACNKSEHNGGSCVLASPSYPGVYPPHRQCKYHITTSSENIQVRISFTALLLPQNCKTDYISIYQGSTTSSPLLTTLCGNQRKTLEYSGLNLLLEFRSGAQQPPFDYNGFVATLKFFEKFVTTEISTTTTHSNPRTTMSNLIISLNETVMSTMESSGCDILISGNNNRSGHFDTRQHEWNPICRLVFQGRITDVVHVSFFNYRLRTSSCKSIIEVIDNSVEDKRSVVDRICSPVVKQVKDQDSRSVEPTFLSTGNTMIITLKRPSAPLSTNEAEFLAGAYFFHDEQISGTMQPNALCDVKFNGLNSPLAGMIDNPGTQHLYWNIDGPLSCRQQFVPSNNQSITIKVQSIEKMSKEPNCVTQCGDNGCRCVSSSPLKTIDHLMLVGDNNLNIACLCGSFQSEGLPVSARTWGSLTVIYSVAHYTWTKKGFGFSASYGFNTDTICGDNIYTVHSGEITMRNLTLPENLNHFYQQSCTWTLHSNVERQLELDITSNQNRPCTAWNISVHEYSPNPNNQHLGELHHIFCSRDNHKLYLLPWKLNTVVVRLFTLSRTLPQFKIKWRSQVVRANTRFVGAPSAAPNAVSSTENLESNSMGLLMLLILNKVCFWCGPSGLNR